MKVIIAGSRDLTDMNTIIKAIELSGFDITEVVCGMARGADILGRIWAKTNGIPVKEMPADWAPNGEFDPGAGKKRNHDMGDYADRAICIWNGTSSGTKDMFTYMKKLKKPCYIHKMDYVDLFQSFV